MIELNLPYNDLEVTEINGLRHYQTPSGPYPSMTTMLDKSTSKKFLEDWKERVGEKQAERIRVQSAKRGDIIHNLIENYLYGNEIDTSDLFEAYAEMFWSMTPLLDHIKPVGLEVPIYSDLFKLAGRIDCIGYYKGQLAIIDFKTAGKPKKKEYITDYFLQATGYSYMLEELLGIRAEKLVIIVGVHDDDAQVFEADRKEYRNRFKLRVMKFRRWLADQSI